MSSDADTLADTLTHARQALLDARTRGGWWEGELSSSALSTATAVFALRQFLDFAAELLPEAEREILDSQTEKTCHRLVEDGMAWLALHQNGDGGWGDTTLSISNISTTALCWAAFAADARSATPAYASVTAAAENWLWQHAGGSDPAHLIPAIVARYGKDKTFSVPILTMCALAGRLGDGRSAWRSVPQLPFELAACPQRWFKWLKLPVVSYALPALIAIGLVRHVKRPSWNLPARWIRIAARRRALKLLGNIQPASGGFLEATPLTSFVVMSVVAAGEGKHAVSRNGIAFLIRSARADGSWPIDTNLATWVTTLSVNALSEQLTTTVPQRDRSKIHQWLLDQQYRCEHPYTLADPGAWAWTPLTGGVPDADDTPGALLALRNLGIFDDRTKQAAAAGVKWLLDLQNRDGGIPTFCRGWGNLPFDRSSADLTAHALRAIRTWIDDLPEDLAQRAQIASARAIEYLIRVQHPDGSWTPLWFGNQYAPDDINPTYGTARVLLAAQAGRQGGAAWAQHLSSAVDWLLAAQRPGGGWGAGHDTPPSIEETALAVEALADILRAGLPRANADVTQQNTVGSALADACLGTAQIGPGSTIGDPRSASAKADPTRHDHPLEPGLNNQTPPDASAKADPARHGHPLVELVDYERVRSAVDRGVTWLENATDRGRKFDPSPIGFYFAKLWYFEKLYPLIFTVASLEAACAVRNAKTPE